MKYTLEAKFLHIGWKESIHDRPLEPLPKKRLEAKYRAGQGWRPYRVVRGKKVVYTPRFTAR